MPQQIQRLLLLGLLALPVAACGTQGSGTGSASPQASPGAVISIVTDPATIGAYSPPSATVKAGDTVQWTFVDKNPHTVTADAASSFHSTVMADGRTFTHRFDTAGTYPYHCNIHPEMHGTVVVG